MDGFIELDIDFEYENFVYQVDKALERWHINNDGCRIYMYQIRFEYNSKNTKINKIVGIDIKYHD